MKRFLRVYLERKKTNTAENMRYGDRAYGYWLLKREQRLAKLGSARLVEKLEQQKVAQEKSVRRLTAECWERIKRNDRPDLFVNDKRAYYLEVYLRSEHWRALRLRKLEVSPVCEVCGVSFRVQVHHLRYRNLYDVLVEDLQTLCRKHHMLEHFR